MFIHMPLPWNLHALHGWTMVEVTPKKVAYYRRRIWYLYFETTESGSNQGGEMKIDTEEEG